jgi:hypothetical protein
MARRRAQRLTGAPRHVGEQERHGAGRQIEHGSLLSECGDRRGIAEQVDATLNLYQVAS